MLDWLPVNTHPHLRRQLLFHTNPSAGKVERWWIPLRYIWRDTLAPLGHPFTLNTLRQRQNGRHFADDIFKCIFLNFVPRGPINNIPSLVQIMAWRRPGDKPLSEPMMVCLLTHLCVTRLQWFKWLVFFQHEIFISNVVHHKCNIFIWNWSNTMNV